MSGLLELGRATDDFPARPSIDQPTGSRFGASPPSPGQGGEEDPREDAHARHRDERPQHVRQRARPRLEAARVQLRRRARAPVRRSRHGRREENEQARRHSGLHEFGVRRRRRGQRRAPVSPRQASLFDPARGFSKRLGGDVRVRARGVRAPCVCRARGGAPRARRRAESRARRAARARRAETRGRARGRRPRWRARSPRTSPDTNKRRRPRRRRSVTRRRRRATRERRCCASARAPRRGGARAARRSSRRWPRLSV